MEIFLKLEGSIKSNYSKTNNKPVLFVLQPPPVYHLVVAKINTKKNLVPSAASNCSTLPPHLKSFATENAAACGINHTF